MFISVSDALKNPGQSYPLQAETAISDLEVMGDPLSFENIVVKGEIIGAEDSVNVIADITAVAHTRCSRCLGDMTLPVTASVNENFVRTPDPEDPDQYELLGYQIDLDPLVKDALLLEIPIRFLCSEDCKGLCPVCGVNRNLVSCTCHEGVEKENPFSALKVMFNNEEV